MSDIIDRLRHAITTASNDDISEPMTEKRMRHIARIEYMGDAIEEIERLRGLIGDKQYVQTLADYIVRLQAAIQRYGLHTWDCAFNDSKGEQPCDCGWEKLQTELRGADVETKTDAS